MPSACCQTRSAFGKSSSAFQANQGNLAGTHLHLKVLGQAVLKEGVQLLAARHPRALAGAQPARQGMVKQSCQLILGKRCLHTSCSRQTARRLPTLQTTAGQKQLRH